MPDQPTLKITDPDNVAITFVNEVGNVGFLNGILNVTFTAARFTPDGTQIAPDIVVASRLRMDLQCAQQLHTMIGSIIEANTTQPKSGLN
jgi:altronate dehydratase